MDSVPWQGYPHLLIGMLQDVSNLFIFLIKFCSFYSVRAVLGLCVLGSFHVFRKAVEFVFGAQIAIWFLTITLTQYHFMFYLSRPLPNIFALPLGEYCTVFCAKNATSTYLIVIA